MTSMLYDLRHNKQRNSKKSSEIIDPRGFLVRVTGFEPAASWSQRNGSFAFASFWCFPVLFNPEKCALLTVCSGVTTCSVREYGQECGQRTGDSKQIIKLEFVLQNHQQCSGSDQDAAHHRLCSKFFMQENKCQHQCDDYGQLINRDDFGSISHLKCLVIT